MPHAITCEGLTRRFKRVVALDGLDLQVDEGAIFGFLGPNGAGKTTTLRLLAGLTNPTEGRVWISGQPVSAGSLDLRSSIGYLPEAPAFYGWMTGREFLRYTAELYGMPIREARERGDSLLLQVGLGEAADRRIRGYSRGMQQRLGIAQAMMNRPRVLLLDEPASALDPVGRRDMLELIAALKGQTTVFLSTHILGDVERVCDRVAIIDKGRMVAQGNIEELRAQRQANRFVIEAEEDLTPVAEALGAVPWIASAGIAHRQGHQVLEVDARDLDEAKRALPRLLLEHGVTLLGYRLASVSLEDIFVELVGGEAIQP